MQKYLEHFLRNFYWYLVGIVIALALFCGTPGCAISQFIEPARVVQLCNSDTGKAYSSMVLPKDKELVFITDKTVWTPIAFMGAGDYLLLGTAVPEISALYVILCVFATPDNRIVPIAMNLEDFTKVKGKRFVKGWWYGGDGTKYPEVVDLRTLSKNLKAHMGLDDGSI